jgi:hypothetical protein
VEYFINSTVQDLEDEVSISFSSGQSDAIQRRASSPGILLEPSLIPTLRAGQDGVLFDFCKCRDVYMILMIITK